MALCFSDYIIQVTSQEAGYNKTEFGKKAPRVLLCGQYNYTYILVSPWTRTTEDFIMRGKVVGVLSRNQSFYELIEISS